MLNICKIYFIIIIFCILLCTANIRTILREQQPDRYPRGRTKTHKNLQDDDTNEQYGESSYIFKPGLIPPHKQMFYQVKR